LRVGTRLRTRFEHQFRQNSPEVDPRSNPDNRSCPRPSSAVQEEVAEEAAKAPAAVLLARRPPPPSPPPWGRTPRVNCRKPSRSSVSGRTLCRSSDLGSLEDRAQSDRLIGVVLRARRHTNWRPQDPPRVFPADPRSPTSPDTVIETACRNIAARPRRPLP